MNTMVALAWGTLVRAKNSLFILLTCAAKLVSVALLVD